eukprot:s274_g7.t1
MKGSFPRCWKCGYEWALCADRAHVPQEYRQAQQAQQQTYNQGTTEGYAPPWNGEPWQEKSTQSPRSKSRRPSQRAKRNQNQHQGQAQKGKGKGKEGKSKDPYAQQMPAHVPPMMPQMLQYPPPNMMPMQYNQGLGKGMPPPPLGPPPGHFGAPSSSTSWVPTMQMMPAPVPSFPATSTVNAEEQKAELNAQKKLTQLLGAMKKEEETLSPTLQNMAHQMQKKDERETTKGVCDAAQKLGKMKEQLLDAEQARAQYLSQWKTFLQQSVTKWREFAAQFNASDSAHQAAILNAHMEVRKAQKKFDQSTKRDQAKGDDSKVEEISDEDEEPDMEIEALRGAGAQKIQDGMQVIVSSLVELSESADQLEQRVKRPRKSKEEEAKTAEDGSAPAAPSFG